MEMMKTAMGIDRCTCNKWIKNSHLILETDEKSTNLVRSVFVFVGCFVAKDNQGKHCHTIEQPSGEAEKINQTFNVSGDDEDDWKVVDGSGGDSIVNWSLETGHVRGRMK